MSDPNLYEFLRAQPSVALIAGQRNYFPVNIPQHIRDEQTKVPCVVFTAVGNRRTRTFCGHDRLAAKSYRIDCYSPDFDQAIALRDAVRAVLIDYAGLMGATQVNNVFLDTDADVGPEPEPGLYVESQTFTIWYYD